MKKLIIIFLLIGCSEEAAKIAPTYTDISGDWQFESKDFSGSFKIVKTLSSDFATESPNIFVIKGKTYTSTSSAALTIDGLHITYGIRLSEPDGFIELQDVIYKSDFTEMTSEYQTYGENCLSVPCSHVSSYQQIKISRK